MSRPRPNPPRIGPLTHVVLMAIAMTVFLVIMLVRHEQARANSPELVMAVEGYDPRDMLLGHYAQLRTPLHALDPDRLDGDNAFEAGVPIFVTLEIGEDGLASPVSLHRDHPGTGLVATGYVRHAGDRVRAQFNIERYYAGRREALALEDRLRGVRTDGEPENGPENEPGNSQVRVILAVPASGHLLIKGFEIDGERRIDRVW
ncbi:GDYXXLXY domain-containing protein [Maricaulis sp. W15]|uniref:GDYXXLXY domain-containing protein n=1 Tax=Maricaulis sp. W15 TaxID=1772333 RepID=UPI0009FB3144|nr:GDYXXLXY domain-containing protein [Maricaulis sp. W15]